MSATLPVIEPEPYRSRIHRTLAALAFVKRLLAKRGNVSDLDMVRLQHEGYGDAEIEAIVSMVSGPGGRHGPRRS
jgi:hypothetical protein